MGPVSRDPLPPRGLDRLRPSGGSKTLTEEFHTMRDLNHQLIQLCRTNRDGSYQTQHARRRALTLIANQLHDLGFRKMRAVSLKPKHVEALVERWRQEGLSAGTIKNRLSVLRWWADKVNRQNVIARDNDHYGVPTRTFVTNVSKETSVDAADLARVTDPHVRMSLELQQAFGLRREEAIKFSPTYADRGDTLVLKATWTKGGKARSIPVRKAAQREVLDRARRLAGRGSLIPAQRNYKAQLRIYERQTANAGLSKLHGLRHRYAQQRYQELTGWKAPALGGPSARNLSPVQRAWDRHVRLVISQELGHERPTISSVYLGR